MIDRLKGARLDVKLWLPIDKVQSSALTQLRNITYLPWVTDVAAMPDVHAGKGTTIGSVIAMKGAISPSAVGSDIGCGMMAVKTNLRLESLPDTLDAIYEDVLKAIPLGNGPKHDALVRTPLDTEKLWGAFKTLTGVDQLFERARQQLGTLGGGNHFIEFNADTEGNIWLMLHSGSRNVGKTLADTHTRIAMKQPHNHTAVVPDRALSVLLEGTPEFDAYVNDLMWAQDYAMYNRSTMMWLYQEVIRKHFPQVTFAPAVACHHNYVAKEVHAGEEVYVTRKGAIRAAVGTYGIIPGAMGAKSYIVSGLGSEEAMFSASHGAGRLKGRKEAKKLWTEEDVAKQTEGLICRKDAGIRDELKENYKDIDEVMSYQKDLVTPVTELRALINWKG